MKKTLTLITTLASMSLGALSMFGQSAYLSTNTTVSGDSLTALNNYVTANPTTTLINVADVTALNAAWTALGAGAAQDLASEQFGPHRITTVDRQALLSMNANRVSMLARHLRDVRESRGMAIGGMSVASVASLSQPLVAASDSTMMQSRSISAPWSVFLNLGGTFAAQKNKWKDSFGYDSDSFDLLTGGDYRVNDMLVVGGFFGYDKLSVDVKDTGKSKVKADLFTFGAYATAAMDGFYGDFMMGYTHGKVENKRKIVFTGVDLVAKGKPKSSQFNIYAGTGYDFTWNEVKFGPTLALNYTATDIKSYTETGANAANLHIGKNKSNSFTSDLGAHVDYLIQIDSADIVADLGAGWQHEFADNRKWISSSYSTGTSFSTRTGRTPSDFFVISPSVNVMWGMGIDTAVTYKYRNGNRNYSDHVINAEVRYSF